MGKAVVGPLGGHSSPTQGSQSLFSSRSKHNGKEKQWL